MHVAYSNTSEVSVMSFRWPLAIGYRRISPTIALSHSGVSRQTSSLHSCPPAVGLFTEKQTSSVMESFSSEAFALSHGLAHSEPPILSRALQAELLHVLENLPSKKKGMCTIGPFFALFGSISLPTLHFRPRLFFCLSLHPLLFSLLSSQQLLPMIAKETVKRRLQDHSHSDTDSRCSIGDLPVKRYRLSDTLERSSPHPILLQPKPARPPSGVPGAANSSGYEAFLNDSVENSDHAKSWPVYHTDPFVLEWLSSIPTGSSVITAREQFCRSDSCLKSPNIPAFSLDSRPKSAPTMPANPAQSSNHQPSSFDFEGYGYTQPTVVSHISSYAQSQAASSVSSGSQSRNHVQQANYRRILVHNHIHEPAHMQSYPEHVRKLLDVIRKERQSPDPLQEDIAADDSLFNLTRGASETQVEAYLHQKFFPTTNDALQRSDRHPMAKRSIPTASNFANMRVSNPVPDMLYGYRSEVAFTAEQQAKLDFLPNIANNESLSLPFFAIEAKGDGPSSQPSLWVATNQCLGAASSCVNLAEKFRTELFKHRSRAGTDSSPIHAVDSTAFSVATNGCETRLYVSWKQGDLDFHTGIAGHYILQDPEHFVRFRRHIRNVLDWGRDNRLATVKRALDDFILEERVQQQQQQQGPYPGNPMPPPPTAGSRTRTRSQRKRQRASSSYGGGGPSSGDSTQGSGE